MKKVFALLLAIVLCFSLCACGGQSEPELTKEELISTDLKTDIMTLQGEVYSNKVKAMQDYGNKPIIISGKVLTVETDHVVLCESQVCLDAYLSVEDLMKVESGEIISVAGIIKEIKEVTLNWADMPFSSPHCIMDVAYLVD